MNPVAIHTSDILVKEIVLVLVSFQINHFITHAGCIAAGVG